MTETTKRVTELLSSSDNKLGGSPDNPMYIENPLMLLFGKDGKLICHIHPRPKDTYKDYSLMICDIVRHLANAFKVDVSQMWDLIDKERENPTTAIDNLN